MTDIRVAFQVGSRLDGGMARYAQELGRELASLGEVELVPIGTPEVLDALHESLGRPSDRIEVPAGRLSEAITMRARLGRMVRGRADVVHGTKHLLPRWCPVPTVLTVQDVLPLDDPGAYTLDKRLLLPRQYRASIQEATAIVAASQATADRMARQVPGVLERTTVLRTVPPPAAVAAAATPPDRPLSRFGLYVGDLSPRKNLGFLLDLWQEVHRRTGRPLVLAGPDGWRAGAVLDRLPDLEAQGVVHRLGFVSDGVLRWLYEHTEVVVLASRYEGTGLPLVEALALGAAVVASDEPALVEYAEGRALHLPLDDPGPWVEALVRALSGEAHRVPAAPRADPALEARAWAAAQVAIYRSLLDA